MKAAAVLHTLLLAAFPAVTFARSAPNSDKAVLLSDIQSLTLHGGKKTSHRRVKAAPQLKCVGGNGRGKYDVDTMRCTNQGSSYSDADVEWSCTASLPPEFKLGSTDVTCEGYRDSDDPWVLKGSCGVEYRLILTEMGERKFGKSWTSPKSWGYNVEQEPDRAVKIVFWALFIGVVLWMIYSVLQPRQRGRGPRPPRGGGGGGGGGGGPGFWPGHDDPPPPYSPWSPYNSYGKYSGWRPGFWSGAGAGATAGYAAGRYQGSRTWDRGEGSSGSVSSSRHTSTGFGSSSRR